MKIYYIKVLLLIVMFASCKATDVTEDISSNKAEILELKTASSKRKYLEAIFKDDQKVRGDKSSEILITYGKDSQEFRDFIDIQLTQDAENLKKIESYFTIHGHPKRSEVGEIAAITPWAVIHHSNDYNSRKRNFKYLYKAFKNNDLDDGQISMFLGRMYQIKKGTRFKMERPYSSKDEINQLIAELDLTVVEPN